MSLYNQALFLKKGEHWAAALGPIQECVEIRRRLAKQYPLDHNKRLRRDMCVLEECLRKLGKEEEAEKAREEADGVHIEP